MEAHKKKTLGQAIDEIVAALEALDDAARATAVHAACEHLGLSSVQAPSVNQRESPPAIPPESRGQLGAATSAQQGVVDIRSLKEQRQPASGVEMACLVAYYLDTMAPPAERKKEVSTPDLDKYFKQAGYRLRKRMPQVLVDARAAGYFDSAGHGKYKLNPVGYNLVVHSLPKAKSK